MTSVFYFTVIVRRDIRNECGPISKNPKRIPSIVEWYDERYFCTTFPLNHCLQSFTFDSSVSHDIVLNYVSPVHHWTHWIISIDKFSVKWHFLRLNSSSAFNTLWLVTGSNTESLSIDWFIEFVTYIHLKGIVMKL